ncbi:hypothetical protein J3Q64DRAFT_1713154 [Phycomyces blakesleeanus]|uniref:Uncharacterized protein n=1 Tax=Phycomyces blakesleeanus TaxID=4837 RepID=A0ABR3BHP1_PHYBL
MNPLNFQIPRRRGNDTISPFPKRRRTEANDQLLNTLFDKLKKEPLLEDVWAKEERALEELNENSEESQPIVDVASQFLDKEVSERLAEALSRNDVSDDSEPPSTRYFFTLPTKTSIGEWPMDSRDGAGVAKAEFIHKLTQTTQGRSFMLESGCLKHWHKRGWECPRSLYKYLFEMVAFEPNKVVAKQAYFTLVSLWSYFKMESDVQYSDYPVGCIEPEWLTSIFEAYGRAPQLITKFASKTTPTPISTPISTPASTVRPTPEFEPELISKSKVPQSSLGWIIELFGISIKQWPSAYRDNIDQLLGLLLDTSLDPTSRPALGALQTTIQGCLDLLEQTTWKKTLAEFDIDYKKYSEYQLLYCIQAIPPTNKRGVFFQQCLAAKGLGLSRDHDKLEDVLKLINDPDGMFSSSQPDYSLLAIKIRLLDIFIGSDEDELDLEKDTVQSLIQSLQLLSRKIGGRLGTLKRTVANECAQRLWNKLAYTIGRDERVIEDHQV